MEEPNVKLLPFIEVLRDAKLHKNLRHPVDRLETKTEKFVNKVTKIYFRQLRSLNLTIDVVPNNEELVIQAKELCRDYIFTRLNNAGLEYKRFKPSKYLNTELSNQIISIGDDLEHKYPELYRNISRQLNMTMSSEEIVKRTYTSVAEHICKGDLHWGKVLALFAMAGGFSIDCVVQGRPDYVNKVVDCFGVFIGKHVVDWLSEQGGWNDIITVSKGSTDNSLFWALSGFGAFVGFLLTLMTMVQL